MYITNVLPILIVVNGKRHLSMTIGDDVFRFITESLICNIFAELILIYIGYLSSLVYIGGHYVFFQRINSNLFLRWSFKFYTIHTFLALSNDS